MKAPRQSMLAATLLGSLWVFFPTTSNAQKDDTPPAVQALIDALKDKEPDVRKTSAQSLGKIGKEAKAAVPALAEALKDKDVNVRGAAALALGRMGSEARD